MCALPLIPRRSFPSLRHFLILVTAVLGMASSARAQIPAFPGAEGFGAYATGGRGGDVYYVVNLNTSGVGSFADAIATAPSNGRTIVFGVSGYIHVNKTTLAKSKITIAGQTAPGDGIGFKDGTFIINGSDVVIRHARFRYGAQTAGGDCINLGDGITNVILDHVSMAFSTDENISSFSQNPRPDFFTFQWSLNAWGLESHSCGGLWDLNRVTTHHTLWSHHHTRNPKARPDGLLDWINNITFDWDIGFIMGDSTTPAAWKANVRGNYFVCPPGNLRSVALEKASIDRNGNYNFTLHAGNNLFDKNGNSILDGADYGYGIASGSYQVSNAPITISGAQVPVAADPPLTAYKKIVSRAGPLRLDALAAIPLRDEVDTILLNNLVTLKRNHVSHENQTGASNNGMGYLNSAPAPSDTDRDGMPDVWEQTLGWNSASQDHNTALASSGGFVTGLTFLPTGTPAGYTRLEEYLHFLTIPHATISKNTAESTSSLSVDLRKFTAGFNRAPVVFALSNITNGTAVLQPDGYTVVFTPPLNASGRARFDFTVTDGDGSTWAQTFGVLVSAIGVPRDLRWKGDGTANVWSTNVLNFLHFTNLTGFSFGDNVLFDDTGSASPAVNLTIAAAPSSIEVAGSKNYTFAGVGSWSGAGPLTKTGPGTLTVTTTNSSYTGAIDLAGGTLSLTGAGGNIGSGPLTIRSGASFNLPASGNALYFGGPVIVPSGETATISSGILSSGLSGNVSSGDDTSLLNVSGSLSLSGTTTAQLDGFSGTIHLKPGASLRFSANSAGNTYGSLNPSFVVDGTLQPRNAGNTVRLGSIRGSGTLAGPQSNGSSGATTFQIGGNNADGYFSGNILSNTATPGSLVGLTKLGSGTLTLAGNNNTYSGTTSVGAGTLLVNGTNLSSPVVISNTATLGGTGRIGGLVTANNGGRLAPGTNVGTLFLGGGLTLNSAVLDYELAATTAVGGGINDLVVLDGGTLALSGTTTLNPIFLNGSLAMGAYTLITGGSATVGGAANLAWGAASGGRQTFSFDTSVPGTVRLLVGGSPAANLIWSGASSSAWDMMSSNWVNGGISDVFFNMDVVRFDATGAGRSSVNLTGTLYPAAIHVDAANDYTFTGTGALAGQGSLTKSGSGNLIIATTNSAYAGQFIIAGGAVVRAAGAILGSGPTILRGGGRFEMGSSSGGALFYGGKITVPAGETGTLGSGGLGNVASGDIISGDTNSLLFLSGGVSFGKTDSSQLDGFTGTINIQPGATLRFAANSSGNTYGSLKPTFVINGTFQPRNAGNTLQLGALSGSGMLTGPQSNAGVGNTVYIIGGNNLDVTFGGVISSQTAAVGSLVVLNKIGTGTLTLTGNSTYTGGTTVNAGGLMVNNVAGSGTGTGDLRVKGGARLGGSGSINSATTLDDFAVLNPGNGVGTLTFNGDLSIGEFSRLNFELGTVSDLVVVQGALSLSGRLTVTAANGFGPGTYTLFSYNPTNTFNDSGLVIEAGPAGYRYSIDTATPGLVRLVVALPVPPAFNGAVVSGGNVVLTGSGGTPGAPFRLLTSTNLTLPLPLWTRILTNAFDDTGSFWITNEINSGLRQCFYRLEVP